MNSTAEQDWTAPSEEVAVVVKALAASDGLPVPTEVEFAERFIEQLGERGYRVAPITTRRRAFQPAVLPGLHGNIVPWIWPGSGQVAFSHSVLASPGEGWLLLYFEVIEDVDTSASKKG